MSQLESEEVRGNAAAMMRLALEAGYEDYLKENYANYRSRLEDLEQLAIFAQQFESLEDFLTELALLTNLEAEEDQPGPKDDEQLRLSTVHQAKGLEWPVVFVPCLTDRRFPSGYAGKTQDWLLPDHVFPAEARSRYEGGDAEERRRQRPGARDQRARHRAPAVSR